MDLCVIHKELSDRRYTYASVSVS